MTTELLKDGIQIHKIKNSDRYFKKYMTDKFKEDYEAANGKLPIDMHAYFYNAIWAAIYAIELAGTDDPEAIAQAARSGNLEFDTPSGRAHFGPDGHSGLGHSFIQIQDKALVPYQQ